MTTKERLHELVDRLPDSETDRAAQFLEELAVQETPNTLPRSEEMMGSIPDLTGELSTAEYLRLIRGG